MTVKVWRTAAAALYTALPAWAAVILQVPGLSSVIVVLLTVQTAFVDEVSVTDRPDEAVGLTSTVGASIDWGPGLANVIV